MAQLDYANFGREVAALGQDLQRESSGSAEVLEHLQKMMAWRNACAILGVCTLWTTPNPITIAALSTWTYASWVVVAHHTCHGGYNRVATTMDKSGSSSSNNNNPFHSRGFALGTVQQRCKDWLDWILPEAWNMEHNRLHHYRLNELNDPDLVQRNMENIRSGTMPMAAKYGVVGFFVLFWKWFYYAPNTFKELQINKWKQEGRELPGGFDPKGSVTVATLFGRGPEFQALRQVVPPTELFGKVLAPFFMGRFVLLPAPLLLVPGVGPTLFAHAVINLVAADILTNMHAFCTIVTNHAGEDLYTFDDAVKPKSPSFYVRQIVGSANFETDRTDVPDFLHGFLNYQIEHHVWPDLSTLQYQRAAPRLREICHRYGVPYVQESVWTRLAKTVDIMVGKTSMRPFPTQFEPAADKAVTSNKGWKTSHGDINEEEYQ